MLEEKHFLKSKKKNEKLIRTIDFTINKINEKLKPADLRILSDGLDELRNVLPEIYEKLYETNKLLELSFYTGFNGFLSNVDYLLLALLNFVSDQVTPVKIHEVGNINRKYVLCYRFVYNSKQLEDGTTEFDFIDMTFEKKDSNRLNLELKSTSSEVNPYYQSDGRVFTCYDAIRLDVDKESGVFGLDLGSANEVYNYYNSTVEYVSPMRRHWYELFGRSTYHFNISNKISNPDHFSDEDFKDMILYFKNKFEKAY